MTATTTTTRFEFLKFFSTNPYSSWLWIICCSQDILCEKKNRLLNQVDFQWQNLAIALALVAAVKSKAPCIRIESFATVNLRGVSTKLCNRGQKCWDT